MLCGNLAGVPEAESQTIAVIRRPPVVSVCHVMSGDLWAGAEVQAAALLRHLARNEEIQLSALILNEGRLAAELRTCGVDVNVIPENEHGFAAIVRLAGN